MCRGPARFLIFILALSVGALALLGAFAPVHAVADGAPGVESTSGTSSEYEFEANTNRRFLTVGAQCFPRVARSEDDAARSLPTDAH